MLHNLFNEGGANAVLLQESGLLEADWMKHDSDAVLFPPSRANGPSILLNSDLTKHCCWQESMDFVSAASLEIDGCRIFLVVTTGEPGSDDQTGAGITCGDDAESTAAG